MEPGELQALTLRANGGNNHAATVELLQVMRTHRVHRPDLVCSLGARLLSGGQRKLGSDQWSVLEQVFFAAAELGVDGWRSHCLKALQKQFPSSGRVKRLEGIEKECTGDWNDAKKIYQEILNDKPEDTFVRKRLIAICRQRGGVAEAIEEINKYLEMFSTDVDVWHELGELYIEAGTLSRAVFCFEELVSSNPRSLYNILTYAELLYSTGDYELSRKYYGFASYIDDRCLRALWGLVAVNAALAEKDKSQEKMAQLQTLAIDKLHVVYKDVGAHGRLADSLLKESFLP